MPTIPLIRESAWRLRHDILWAHALLWFARTARGGTPKPGVHLFLADRYGLLARYHSKQGHDRRARRLDELAAWHFKQGYPGQPPLAAAGVMPIPGAPIHTQAVSPYPEGPDEAA